MLTNRDLNLLCRILEMREQQLARIEQRRERYAERFRARRVVPRAGMPTRLEVRP